MTPFMNTDGSLAFDKVNPVDVGPAVDMLVDKIDAVVSSLRDEKPNSFSKAWLPLEDATEALSTAWGAVSHLDAVLGTREIREAINANQGKVVGCGSRISQDSTLYAIFEAVSKSSEFCCLADEDQVALRRALRDFHLCGVALAPADKKRFGDIVMELARLEHEFNSAVLDATQAWTLHLADDARLKGLSDTDKAMLAMFARAAGLDGWLVTLQAPCVNAIMTFAQDGDLRKVVYEAQGTRASDKGPYAGRFDNGPRIKEILRLRHEAAKLLGYGNAVELILATRMAESAAQVRSFLLNLADKVKPAAKEQLSELRVFARDELGIDELMPWDLGYVSEQLRRKRYTLDEAQVRPYFPVTHVLEGWKKLLRTIFGIELRERRDVSVWHEDVTYFDVVEANGDLCGGLYLDLFARQGKRSGAWMSQALARRETAVTQHPVAHLVCNFPAKDSQGVALLSHGQIKTLLHETGHTLNLLFTRVNRPSIGGTNGIEWDAIEIPSQLMEGFAWDYRVLSDMSGKVDTGEKLPDDLFERMLAARYFGAGMGLLSQVEAALFDLDLHSAKPGTDPMEVLRLVHDEVAIMEMPEWHRFPCAFSHIFAGGYAAGYYSYLWAEWFAADGFQYFAEHGTLSRDIGDAFRSAILQRGAVRSAADNFIAFRGRMPSMTPLLERYGMR